MKELFNTLSKTSEFFNEKRFIYQKPPEGTPKAKEAPKPEPGKPAITPDTARNQGRALPSRVPFQKKEDPEARRKEEEARKQKEEEAAERKQNEKKAKTAIEDYFEDPDNNRSMWTKGAKGMLDNISKQWDSYKTKIIKVIADYRSKKLIEAARNENPSANTKKGAGSEEMEVGAEQGAVKLKEGPEIFNHFQAALKKNRQFYERSSVEYCAYDKYDLNDKANAVASNVITKILPSNGFEYFVKGPVLNELRLARGEAPQGVKVARRERAKGKKR